ncbi:MAG: META domain-containing protein [Verrucomicrobia bacterium]|nr:META domain-containing protein [Verrucomicrobiota bacterium]
MKTLHVFLCALVLSSGACASRPVRSAGGHASAPVPAKIPVLKSLAGTNWTVVELAGSVVVNATEGWPAPSLEFDVNGQAVTGHGGVNRFGGRYSEAGAALSFGPLAMTRRIGPAGQMQLETTYTQVLSRVVGWRQQGAQVILNGPSGERAAVLERAPAKPSE